MRQLGEASDRASASAALDQTSAFFALKNRTAGGGPYFLQAEIAGNALHDLSWRLATKMPRRSGKKFR